jgi:hypothetical protein
MRNKTLIAFPKMHNALEALIDAADQHAEDSGEPDMAIGDLQDLLREAFRLMSPAQRMQLLRSQTSGDLQDLLREAFRLMSPAQRMQLLRSQTSDDVMTAGTGDPFSKRALRGMEQEVERVRKSLEVCGYRFEESPETGAFWWAFEARNEVSEDFPDLASAVESAALDRAGAAPSKS